MNAENSQTGTWILFFLSLGTPSPSIHNLYGPFFPYLAGKLVTLQGGREKSATRAITAAIWGIIAYKNRGGREVAAAAFSRLANTGLDSEKKWQGRVVRIQPQESSPDNRFMGIMKSYGKAS